MARRPVQFMESNEYTVESNRFERLFRKLFQTQTIIFAGFLHGLEQENNFLYIARNHMKYSSSTCECERIYTHFARKEKSCVVIPVINGMPEFIRILGGTTKGTTHGTEQGASDNERTRH